MFSVIFPGQGSQLVGMGKEFFDKFDLVKGLFKEADNILDIPLSKIILDGPKEELDLTINAQPSIFLVSYSIFQVIKKEFNIDLNKASATTVPHEIFHATLLSKIKTNAEAAKLAENMMRSVRKTLPKNSPLWDHPKVKITPHIASLTYPKESTYQVLDCFDRLEKGLPLPQEVSRKKMY